jgi:hypothetical protein
MEEISVLKKQLQESAPAGDSGLKEISQENVIIFLYQVELKRKVESMALKILNSSTSQPRKHKNARRQTWFPGVIPEFDKEEILPIASPISTKPTTGIFEITEHINNSDPNLINQINQICEGKIVDEVSECLQVNIINHSAPSEIYFISSSTNKIF